MIEILKSNEVGFAFRQSFMHLLGLGKSVTIQSQIPDCEGRPEQTVRELIDNAKNVTRVANCMALSCF